MIDTCLVFSCHSVWQNVKLMFLAGTLDAFLDFFCVFLFSLTKSKIMRRLRTGLFQKLLHQGVPFFDREKTGELASRLTSDIGTELLQPQLQLQLQLELQFVWFEKWIWIGLSWTAIEL